MTHDVIYPSPHIFVGEEEFETESGARVVPVYRSSDATLILVPTDMATQLSRHQIPTGQFADVDLKSLLDAKLLCTDPDSVQRDAYQRIFDAIETRRKRTFVILPTSYCNMGCKYCGQEHTRGGLSRDHRVVTVERIIHAIRDSATEAVSVRWFGGEPLMAFAVLKDISAQLIVEADRAGVPYESIIVTNGALLDERKLGVLTRECRISTFHITIDGPEEIHDSHRPLKNGGKSFERLVTLLSKVIIDPEYSDVAFVLRTNVDTQNNDYVSEYLKTMAARGFTNRSNVTFSLVPVHPWSNDVSALEINKRQYAHKEIEWLNEMNDLGLNFQLLPTATKPIACGAITRRAEVLSSTGSMFSCTEQPLVPEHESDSVLISLSRLPHDELRPAGKFDDWDQQIAQKVVPCSTCWMLPVCGGHCPKAWSDGDIPCPSMKFNASQRLSLSCTQLGLRSVYPTEAVGMLTGPSHALESR